MIPELTMACGHGDFWGYDGERGCVVCDEVWRRYREFWCQMAIAALCKFVFWKTAVEHFDGLEV